MGARAANPRPAPGDDLAVALTDKERTWLERFRAEEAAAGWDWSGEPDEELAGSKMFAHAKLDYAMDELKTVLRHELWEPWERVARRILSRLGMRLS
jgi:hypothetical protein